MELKQLEYFTIVCEKGSFSQAAECLYTSQPNVSKVISSLEKELGRKRVSAIVRGRASTASVDTLAKNGVGQLRFSCRIASKSGEYPHRKNRAFRLTAETLCFHFWENPKPLKTAM